MVYIYTCIQTLVFDAVLYIIVNSFPKSPSNPSGSWPIRCLRSPVRLRTATQRQLATRSWSWWSEILGHFLENIRWFCWKKYQTSKNWDTVILIHLIHLIRFFFEATELVGRSSKIFQTFPFVDFENPPVIPGKGAKKVPDSCPAGTFWPSRMYLQQWPVFEWRWMESSVGSDDSVGRSQIWNGFPGVLEGAKRFPKKLQMLRPQKMQVLRMMIRISDSKWD